MTIVFAALSALLLLFGASVAFVNLAALASYFFESKHYSLIPLFGGLSLAIGVWLFPFGEFSGYWWIGLLVDWGTIAILALPVV